MSFDCSRFTFNAWHDFLGVVMQQGRVQLDADWNEFVGQLLRRIQAGTLDTFGGPVVPRVTPDGFRIEAAGGALTIGVGRLYVDGLLAENHGAAPWQWNALLAEQTGGVALDYTAQPYYPQPPALPGGGPHLVYLDVWQREVTCLQYPDLVEKAVGIDTTARLQTVWQVKVLAAVGAANCATPDAEIPGWTAATTPSGARLSTSTGAVAATPNPCLIPPGGGYKGLENQLYRVEIHAGGQAGTASFKWSRDNATVASRVNQINMARDRIVVDSLGRDEVLGFADGDWVEITDDRRELHGEPGVMRRIRQGGGVDDATRTLVLETPLPAGIFPTDVQNRTEAGRNTRVRRWDQRGHVLRADGSLYVDLDAPGSAGSIAVPPAGVKLFLEDGILIDLDLDGAGSEFHSGDHWSFAARAADASIELLDRSPPRGIHHHYARLAIVNFPDAESDCRVLWPPVAETGDSCACDRCVTPAGHNAGTETLQQAVDSLAQSGGVICLAAGTYRLREPLRIANAGSLRLRGKGWRTLLVAESPGPLVAISDSEGIAIENLAAAGAASPNATGDGVDGGGLIDARNTLGLELSQLYLLGLSPGDARSLGLSLSGYALGVQVRDCAIVADVGIAGGQGKTGYLLASAVAITASLLLCQRRGIDLARRCLHLGQTRIADNLILGGREAGVRVVGATFPGASVALERNVLQLSGDGIVAGVDGLRILDNELRGADSKAVGSGVVLETGLDPRGVGHCWITGNRIADLPAGAGIAVRTALGSAMIKQNMIERTRRGIAFTAAGAATRLSIENNHLVDIALGVNPESESVVAIQVLATAYADLTGNVVSNFAVNALQAPDRVAIRIVGGGDIRLSGNHLSDLGPRQEYRGYVAGIELVAPFALAMVIDNVISRLPEGDIAAANWQAIRIAPPREQGSNLYADALILTAGKDAFLLTNSRLRVLVGKPAGSVALRGNQIRVRGSGAPLVSVGGVLTTTFTDNHCEAEPVAGVAGRLAMVEIQGGAVIVSQNRVRWTANDFDAINIAGTESFTVLGNITMGNIRIDRGPLPAPWAPLNILAG
ncbi:MAG: DUF6519 domain-containing protein [Porticoccaceae bacterium]